MARLSVATGVAAVLALTVGGVFTVAFVVSVGALLGYVGLLRRSTARAAEARAKTRMLRPPAAPPVAAGDAEPLRRYGT